MKDANIIKWTDSNGNKCFRFTERQVFERPWIIILVAILLLSMVGVEYMLFGSYCSLLPAVIAFFFLFLWWLTIPMKANEAIIEKTVHELMDDIIANDATANDTKVKKSFVHYDTKGTYAIITGRCFLVLHENGDVWEYPFIYHQAAQEEGHYECGLEHRISDTPEHIKAIKPQRWKQIVSKLNISVKSKLWLLIFLILAIGGLAFASVLWLIMELKWWSLLGVCGYVAVHTLVCWMARAIPGKVMGALKYIIDIPFQ